MDTLLIFFAFPLAVIIISIILEKLLRNPIAVASLIFAIFIIVTFAAFDETFLIATLAYTLISFITALIVHLLKDRRRNNCQDILSEILESINNNNENSANSDGNTDETDCGTVHDLLGSNEINTSPNNNYYSYNTKNNYRCSRNRRI